MTRPETYPNSRERKCEFSRKDASINGTWQIHTKGQSPTLGNTAQFNRPALKASSSFFLNVRLEKFGKGGRRTLTLQVCCKNRTSPV